MRKLIVTEFMTLDGVIDSPMWSLKYWNDEIASIKAAETSNNEPLLLGRLTYDGFADAWPQRGNADGGDYFNGTRKYVVSNTLQKAEWNNSVIINGDVVTEIQKLKQEDGPNIMVHGSANLVQWLVKNNLVDGFRLLVYPITLGTGNRLFTEESAATLNLVESKTLSNGVLALVYDVEPAK